MRKILTADSGGMEREVGRRIRSSKTLLLTLSANYSQFMETSKEMVHQLVDVARQRTEEKGQVIKEILMWAAQRKYQEDQLSREGSSFTEQSQDFDLQDDVCDAFNPVLTLGKSRISFAYFLSQLSPVNLHLLKSHTRTHTCTFTHTHSLTHSFVCLYAYMYRWRGIRPRHALTTCFKTCLSVLRD